jgi:transcriptional regulator with XRE-family HTH domain
MLTIGSIRYLLKQSNMRQVSRETGIVYSTLTNISCGINTNPTYRTVKMLSDYFSMEVTNNG